ncbi:MAG TPA: hypothetical protein VL463_36020 [Kofleriaceae bacterium]|nr:hypothetical protein [Kofleriaceae bacterium]
MPRWLAFVIVVAFAVACGGHPPPPPRGVMESDLGEWKFRRFQPLLDVEVWVKDNKAEAYTATYVNDRAEREHPTRLGPTDLVNVFVTRYQKPDGVLREMVRFVRRLAQEAGYQVDEAKIGGVRVVTIAGHDEWWAMWAASGAVVKIGGRGRIDAPGDVVSDYGKRYPSLIEGGVLEGPLPPGPEEQPDKNAPYDPDNPTPDWDKYHPKK